eukprot:6627495-Prymnesium_polylepis.1
MVFFNTQSVTPRRRAADARHTPAPTTHKTHKTHTTHGRTWLTLGKGPRTTFHAHTEGGESAPQGQYSDPTTLCTPLGGRSEAAPRPNRARCVLQLCRRLARLRVRRRAATALLRALRLPLEGSSHLRVPHAAPKRDRHARDRKRPVGLVHKEHADDDDDHLWGGI